MAETSITYDYELSEVRLFTDRAGVANQIVKRSKGKAQVTESKSGDRVVAWSITLPMNQCRGAYTIAKVLPVVNPQQKSPKPNGKGDFLYGELFELRADASSHG